MEVSANAYFQDERKLKERGRIIKEISVDTSNDHAQNSITTGARSSLFSQRSRQRENEFVKSLTTGLRVSIVTDYYTSDVVAGVKNSNYSVCFFSVLCFISSENASLWSISRRMVICKHCYYNPSNGIQLVCLSDSVLSAAAIHKCNYHCRVQDCE